MTTRIFFLVIGILQMLIFCGHLRSQEVIDSICVIVDDEIILESEVIYGINSVLLERGLRSGVSSSQLSEIRQQVIQSYVIQKILLAKANEDTLSVEDRVVNKELNSRLQQLIQQAGSEQALVEYFNRPIPQIKRDLQKAVREGMLIDIARRSLLSSIQIRQQDVIEFYNNYKDDLPLLPERVEISHILLEVKPSEEAQNEAHRKIENALSLLEKGADFDSLARVISEDGSAGQGGRLGYTNRGDLVPEFEEIAFALEPGEISGIIESRYGYHIIRLLERQGEKISCQHILTKLSPTKDDWEIVKLLADSLRNSIADENDFTRLARQYSEDAATRDKGGYLDVHVIDELPTEFRVAVANLEQGVVSEPFVTDYGVHIVRLNKRIPSRIASISEDYQALENMALNAKREEHFLKWIKSQSKNHYIMPEINWQ